MTKVAPNTEPCNSTAPAAFTALPPYLRPANGAAYPVDAFTQITVRCTEAAKWAYAVLTHAGPNGVQVHIPAKAGAIALKTDNGDFRVRPGIYLVSA